MKNLLDIFNKFYERGDKTAIVYRTGVRRFVYSYKDIYALSLKMANWYKEQGINKGDKIILWAPNGPMWVVSFWGSILRGAIILPVDFTSQKEKVEKIAKITDTKIIIQSQYKLDKVNNGSFVIDIEKVENIISDYDTSIEKIEILENDIAEIIYTSGTTGDPKGVILTHKNLLSQVIQVCKHVDMTGFNFLSLLPLSHMFEQMGGLINLQYLGNHVVYIKTLKPSEIMQALEEEDIYAIMLVPRLLQLLKSGIEGKFKGSFLRFFNFIQFTFRKAPVSVRKKVFFYIHKKFGKNFKMFVSGGAKLDIPTANFWSDLGFIVIEGYGLTECSPVLTANTLKYQKIGTVGKPLYGVSIKIKDGEILAKGDNIFPGYYLNTEATEKVFDDGWFKTGDLGEFDEENNLIIKGRSKDLIVTGAGINVYPEDIERVLDGLPDIKESCVLSIDNGNGEEVHAAIILCDNAKTEIEKIILKANNVLDPLQQITSFSVWPHPEFPKTTTLKIQKFKVKEQLKNNQCSDGNNIPQDKLLGYISKVTDKPICDIKEDSLLVNDLGLTSIGRLELVNIIEREYRFDLEDTMINKNTTVKELKNIITNRKYFKTNTHLYSWPNKKWAIFVRKISDFLIVKPLFKIFIKLKVEGLDNLKDIKTPVIFIANHISYLDHPAIYFALPKKIRQRLAVAAREEFFFPEDVSFIVKIFARIAFVFGSLFLNIFVLPQLRGFRKVINHMGKLADKDINILIFPEGERTMNGEMFPLKTGIAVIVNELKLPIVPIKILGIEKVLPRGSALPKRNTVTIKIGKPIVFRDEDITEIIDKCKNSITEL